MKKVKKETPTGSMSGEKGSREKEEKAEGGKLLSYLQFLSKMLGTNRV